jgi:hypothetical protein
VGAVAVRDLRSHLCKAGDVTYERGGVTIHVDKALVKGASSIEIGFDEKRGLLINLN